MKNQYNHADMLDMIFEHRNKSYGAYALRRDYHRSVTRAILITFSMVASMFLWKFAADKLTPAYVSPAEKSVVINLAPEIQLSNKPIEIDMQKPQPSVAQGVSTIRNTEMRVIADNEKASDSIPTVEQMRDIDPGLTTQITSNAIGVTDGVGVEPSFTATSSVPIEPAFYVSPQHMPVFPGGDKALMDFLVKNTKYPIRERDLGIEGKVYVRFIVNEDGSVSNAEVVRSPTVSLGKESLRVVAMLPKFEPGIQQGRKVKVQLILPFSYKINH